MIRIQSRLYELTDEMKDEFRATILQEMIKIQTAQRRIRQKMGREKNTK